MRYWKYVPYISIHKEVYKNTFMKMFTANRKTIYGNIYLLLYTSTKCVLVPKVYPQKIKDYQPSSKIWNYDYYKQMIVIVQTNFLLQFYT